MFAELATISIGTLVPLLAAVAVVVTLRATWAHWVAEAADEGPRAFCEPAGFISSLGSSAVRPMCADEPWRRLSRVFRASIARSTVIADCHRQATVHLGVAELALDHLREELTGLLTLSPSPHFAAVVLVPSATTVHERSRRVPVGLAA